MKRISKQITLGIDPLTGKRIRKRVYGSSKTDLERNIRLTFAEREYAENPSNVIFYDYAQKWLEAYKSMREAATIEMYKNALAKTVTIGRMKLKDVKSLDLQLVINSNLDHPVVCQKIALTLNQIFKQAVHDGIIRRNPAEGLQLPKKTKTEGRALTPEEKEAIKAADLTEEERIFVEILFYFGLRPQEALGLMTKDFNFKTGELKISRAIGYEGNNPYIKQTKTNKPRTVPIPDAFVPVIKSYIQKIQGESKMYLLHRNGNLLSKTAKSDLWLRIRAKINAQLGGTKFIDLTNGLRPYTFRHNFCCECYYRGLSVLKTSELMGNSPQMVMGVYAHLDDSREPLSELRKIVM